MNENSLINTAKIRWLKSQEIFQILKDPPMGLIVSKIPTRPQNGDIFILDSKTIKRKWKQDGWTYMPRKQGIGFREDNENLRIGGENAITCYYSYIINGLLEGEEKVIVMNRRIYKLFPDGQYFFVHYLKDASGNTNNGIKEQQSSSLSTSNIASSLTSQNLQMVQNQFPNECSASRIQKQQIETSSQISEKAENLINKGDEQEFENKQDIQYKGNQNSRKTSASSEYDKLSNPQYPINDYTTMNQQDSSYYSLSSSIVGVANTITKVSSTNTQDTVDRSKIPKASNFSCENGNYILSPTIHSPSLESELVINQNISKMDEENDGTKIIQNNCLNDQKNHQIKDEMYRNNSQHNEHNQFSQNGASSNKQYQYYNRNGQDGDFEQRPGIHTDEIPQKNYNVSHMNFLQQQQNHENCEFSNYEEWQNEYVNSNNLYKNNFHAASVINRNYSSNINNNIQNQNNPNSIMSLNCQVGHQQQLEIEGNYNNQSQYNYDQVDKFNNQRHYSQQNQFINNNKNNGYQNIKDMHYEIQESGRQYQGNSNAAEQFYKNSNERFMSQQQAQINQKNGYNNQQDIQINKMTQHQNHHQQQNISPEKINGRQNNPPSYSKLQERIIELEQRLHKLEFDKKSEYSDTQGRLNSSQHSSSLNHSSQIQNTQDDQDFQNQYLHLQNEVKNINKQNPNNIQFNQHNNYNQQQQRYIPQPPQQEENTQMNKIYQQQFFQQHPQSVYNNNHNNINQQNVNHQQNFNQGNFSQNIYTNTSQQNKDQVMQNQNSQIENPQLQMSKQMIEQRQIEQNQQTMFHQSKDIEIQEEGQKPLPNNRAQKMPDVQHHHESNQIPPIKVTEYSPEWDYTKGGSKMVLCFLPALNNLSEYQKSKFQIGFGNEKVPAYCIQPGVLKCFIPPHEKGLVKLQVFLENQRIDDIDDKPSYFEFRNIEKKKKKQTKKVIFNQDDEFYRNEFKVRIIDKLNSIQDFISSSNSKPNSTGNSNYSANNQDFNIKYQTQGDQQRSEFDVILENLRNNIESLDKYSFDALLSKILAIADTQIKKNQIKKWLDQIDENGYGLIHYIVILGFDSTLVILNEYECSLNLQSRNSITPLQLAFALNQEKIVEILIKSGALGENLNQQLQGGQIKGDIQQLSKILNFGAIYQSRNILDMLVREVTLHDSINNSSLNDHISWNDQDEQEDNYLDLKDLCENANENDLIKNLNAISNQLKDLYKKRRNKKQKNRNNQEGEQYFTDDDIDHHGDDEDDDYEEDDYEEDDDDDDEDEDDDEYSQNYIPQEQNKQLSHDNLEKSSKKHKYLRNYSEINKAFKDKQRDNTEFDEKDDEIYQSQSYQCRIKTIQKNVRGWLLRRQYLDIKYATRVLQNYIRQRIAKKHIKPECKNMIKNKLIDWLSQKH